MQWSMLMLLLASDADSKPEITWLQLDWPPYQIVSGPYAGEGTNDLMSKELISRLPQFSHTIQLTNLQRMEQAFVQAQPGICTMFGTLYSEKRAQNRLFSDAMMVGSIMTVAFIELSLHRHPAMSADSVEFPILAKDPELKGAFQPNRQYPMHIKQIVSSSDTNLIAHNFTSEVNAAALLSSGRVDYVLDYPDRLNYFNQLLPQPINLQFKAIDGVDEFPQSYISCSKDEAGQRAIDAINAVLPELWQDEAYLSAMRRWLDDASWRYLARDVERLQQANATLKP
ncbi:MAG TPA: hypothetical protein VLA40_06405 [Rheinheimera sp.]|nr:hypothetical protein [Rheinheimera sp.]